jgi:hypothetical protein
MQSPYSHCNLLGVGTRNRVQLRLKELPMPDLDQIKQGKQEVRHRRGRFAKGRSGNPAGRLLLAGEGKALTPKSGHND